MSAQGLVGEVSDTGDDRKVIKGSPKTSQVPNRETRRGDLVKTGCDTILAGHDKRFQFESPARMRNRLVIDGRNLLDPAQLRALGFAYEGIGRPIE